MQAYTPLRGGLQSIQVLRGMAALMVVLHHSLRAVTVNAPANMAGAPDTVLNFRLMEVLASGVDIFFVISGFIMIYVAAPYISGAKPVHGFLVRRIVRVLPPYWVITLFIVVNMVLHGAWARGDFDLSATRLAGAFTLFPTFNGQGLVQPILGVGWTLTFELYFYCMFALAISLAGARFLPLLSVMMVGVLGISQLVDSPFAVTTFLQNPLVIEFLMGCGLAQLYLSGRMPRLPKLAPVLAFALLVAGTAWHEGISEAGVRAFVWGPAACLMVMAMLSREQFDGIRWHRMFTLLGDASYSIYLIHIPIIFTFTMPALKVAIAHTGILPPRDLVIAGAFVASVLAGLGFYFVVEQRLHFKRWVKRF